MQQPPGAHPPDPGMRYFMITGTLITGDRQWNMIESVHADDLPDGAAGLASSAERVRKHYAQQLGDPDAHWAGDLTVREMTPTFVVDGHLDGPF